MVNGLNPGVSAVRLGENSLQKDSCWRGTVRGRGRERWRKGGWRGTGREVGSCEIFLPSLDTDVVHKHCYFWSQLLETYVTNTKKFVKSRDKDYIHFYSLSAVHTVYMIYIIYTSSHI